MSWFFRQTLGGRQFWGDVALFHDWRIQQNVITGHYRLLDGSDRRHASGTLNHCRSALAAIRERKQLPPMSGPAVILIHGILRSSKSMKVMRQRLKQEGYTALAFDYPSTRVPLAQSAGFLRQAIASLEGIDEIHLVVHSMGGLLVRCSLTEEHDPRIRRMVMIATPNQGAHMADLVRRNLIYRALFGPAGQQLVSDPDGFIRSLPVPDFEFGVIAGCRGTTAGFNPLIPGDDDGTINVECTRLEGSSDFLRMRGLHTFLTANPEVIAQTIAFLNDGRFVHDARTEALNPMPAPASSA